MVPASAATQELLQPVGLVVVSFSLTNPSHALLVRHGESETEAYFKQLHSLRHSPSFTCSWPFSSCNKNTKMSAIFTEHDGFSHKRNHKIILRLYPTATNFFQHAAD